MDLSKNNFELVRTEMGLTNRDFAKVIGIAETAYTKLKKGTLSVGSRTEHKIRNAFPELNINWLLYGEGDRKNKQATRIITRGQNNASVIGALPEEEDGNTKFVEISPGRYRMSVPLVPEFAKAGYLSGFADQVYMEELPRHEVTVDVYHKGIYIAFEVDGDSMDDGSINSLPSGSIVTARKIKKDLWTSKFHTHRFPYYVIVHNTEGVIVKEISNHDVQGGILTLKSLNPDKDIYPNFEVHLDDVQQILNVVKLERSF